MVLYFSSGILLNFTRCEFFLFIFIGPIIWNNNMVVPPCSRFSWDIINVSRTDGHGDGKEFSDSVRKWNAFKDNLPVSNSNRIITANKGIVFQSHLYGRGKDLCKSISDDVINGSRRCSCYCEWCLQVRSANRCYHGLH